MELGSEYSLDLNRLNRTENNLFSFLNGYNAIYTDSGRSSLRLISGNFNKVLLPEFICESVIKCFCSYSFYPVGEHGELNAESIECLMDEDIDCIFIMHYFGSVQNRRELERVRAFADKRGISIIEDLTHGIFSVPELIGDYCICSIRKWMPIALGGVLFSKNKLPSIEGITKTSDNKRVAGMVLKHLYLKGQLDCNPVYRKIFADCEFELEHKIGVELMSDFSRFVIECTDISLLVEKRRQNYVYLKSKLDELGLKPVFDVFDDGCPFAFVIRVPERNDFRAYLMDNNIFCAVHWPADGICIEDRPMASRNSNELISLPIDQRYGISDMDYMIEVIRGYKGRLVF